MCNRVGEIQSGFSLPEGSKVTKGLSHTDDMCVVVAWEHTLVFGVLCTEGGVGMMKESLRTGNSLQTLLTSSPPNPTGVPLY